jgi:hypothetical protein
MTNEGAGTNDRPGLLLRAGINVAVLIAGGGIGALAVLFWAWLQPLRVTATSSVDPSYMVIEPLVIPWLLWAVGIGGGLFHAAAILKYLRRI